MAVRDRPAIPAERHTEAMRLQESIGYHCFRGMLTPDTEVFLCEATDKSWSLPGV